MHLHAFQTIWILICYRFFSLAIDHLFGRSMLGQLIKQYEVAITLVSECSVLGNGNKLHRLMPFRPLFPCVL